MYIWFVGGDGHEQLSVAEWEKYTEEGYWGAWNWCHHGINNPSPFTHSTIIGQSTHDKGYSCDNMWYLSLKPPKWRMSNGKPFFASRICSFYDKPA